MQWRLKESKCTNFKSFLAYVLKEVVLNLNLVFFEILFTFVSKTLEKPLIEFFVNIQTFECSICFWYENYDD